MARKVDEHFPDSCDLIIVSPVSDNPYAAPQETIAPQGTIVPPLLTGGPLPSPYGPYRETKGIAFAVIFCLVIAAIVRLAQIFMTQSMKEANSRLETDEAALAEAALADIQRIGELNQNLGYLQVFFLLLSIIFWCIWTNLSCKNAWLFRSSNLQSPLADPLNPGEVVTPGWAVGWFFIPIANLWKPFQALTFIRDEASDTFKGGAILGIWATLWIIMIICLFVLTQPGNLETIEAINNYNTRLMINSGIIIAATIPAILVVTTITQAQRNKARKLNVPAV